MAKGGFYVRLGNGKSLCQNVYVGNMAQAHVLAAAGLLSGSGRVDGQAYFITDGPPANFFTFFDSIVEGIGYRIWPKNLWLPRWFGYTLGCIAESIAFLLRPVYKFSPKMSRFAVSYTSTDYTFNSNKAKADFGFIPKYSAKAAFDRTVKHYQR
jgi:nucleoside-diphosphate-sugar epimerase